MQVVQLVDDAAEVAFPVTVGIIERPGVHLVDHGVSPPIISIVLGHRSSATLIRYLVALGHKRFCYVGRRDPLTGKQWGHDERVGAYLDTTKQMGLQNCGMYHISLDDPRSVQQAIATMLSLPDRPTAICAWSDYYALAVIHELQRSGIRVPEDMSVAGHDGSDVATGFGITTMAQPAREIGRMTAKTTLALINQEPLPEKRITVQTTLEPGSTTAAITQDNN